MSDRAFVAVVLCLLVLALLVATFLLFSHPCVRSHTETRHDPGKEGGYEFGYHLGFDGKYETGLHYVPGYPPHDYEVEVCDERAPSRYETLRASR